MKEFTEQEKINVKQSYLMGESTVKIGQKYGVSHKIISRILDEFGIERTGVGRRKYALDEHYFDNIDANNKAYILGFLYSDGSNNLHKSTVSISLQEEDKDILESMRQEMNSEKQLVFLNYSNKHDFGYTYKNQYQLLMYSSHMSKTLASKGVIQNKSLKVTFPEWLDKQYYSHFIRGVYDGDGSIYRGYRNENNQPITVTITATEEFCLSLKEICRDILGINAGIYDASCHNGITKVFTLSGRNVAKIFLDWIYTDSELFLQRKYDRYINYYNIAT